jgi:hypothetical protein
VVKKATWRFRTLGTEAKRVVAAAPSLAAAARQLDVDVTTLHRWFREGKLTRPTPRPRRPLPPVPVAAPGALSPASWATAIRNTYELTVTESVLLDCAVDALHMARDTTLKPADRLSASGRFGRLIQQLNFEAPDGKAQTLSATRTHSRIRLA